MTETGENLEGEKRVDVGGVWVVAGVQERGARDTMIKRDCSGDCCRALPGLRPLPTQDAWMPRRVESWNGYSVFAVDDEEGEEELNEVKEKDDEVEITIIQERRKACGPGRGSQEG